MGRNFLATNLSQREWNIVEDAKREAERQHGQDLSNKEFLIAMANDTRWKRRS